MPASTKQAGMRRYSRERLIRSGAASSWVRFSQRRGKYRDRCTGIPANTRSGAPRYDEGNTSTSCPAACSRFSMSTSLGTITSSGARGKAVTTWRMRMAASQSYDFPGVSGHGIFRTHEHADRTVLTRAHRVLSRTLHLAQRRRRADALSQAYAARAGTPRQRGARHRLTQRRSPQVPAARREVSGTRHRSRVRRPRHLDSRYHARASVPRRLLRLRLHGRGPRTHADGVQYGGRDPSSASARGRVDGLRAQSLSREGDHLESLSRPGQARAHLQLDAPDNQPLGRDERIPARGLGRHVLLSTDSRALVDARALGRLQVREDLIARRWLCAIHGLVSVAGLAFVGRSIARNWSEFRSLHVTLSIAPVWIAGSVVMVFLTYAMQIESWRRILAGWGQHLAFGPAARTWSVANLGRYVPGKVWSVAGLVVLAQRAGVDPGPAAASAFVIQAVSLGSGVAVVAAVTPHSAPPLPLALAGLAGLATILVLLLRPTAVLLGRLVSPMGPLQPLGPCAVFAGTLLTVLSSSTYGAALWMLARW